LKPVEGPPSLFDRNYKEDAMMKNWMILLGILLSFPPVLFAQQTSSENTGKEVKNLVSAVKQANPGDYIDLPSGKRYVLTKEEIDSLNGAFDYEDLSAVETETRDDGTEIKTISNAHTAFIYPDGQSTHILKTGISFTLYLENHIEKKYNIGYYVDNLGDSHDAISIESPQFNVFRASVQFQPISNGTEEVEVVTIRAYNYKGKNFMMRYYSSPGFVWGNVRGNWALKNEARQIEFDIE
jgi:hypothetical protein